MCRSQLSRDTIAGRSRFSACRTVSGRSSAIRVLAGVALALTLLIGASSGVAAADFAPPSTFVHAGAPHASLMTPASGDNDRPILVLYVSFTDAPAPAGRDSGWIASQFFGSSYGNVADYYRAASFGKLKLTAAAETQGTVNDGVVALTIGTQAAFNALGSGRGRSALTAADPYVNFAAFDRDGNGRVGEDELLVYIMEVKPASCGGTRPVGDSLLLDGGKGVDLGNRQWSGATPQANVITHVHEISHQAFGALDPAGYWPAAFDVHARTCAAPASDGTPDASFFGFNAWQKLHLGWIRPKVVTRDGFYSIPRADTTGTAYLLYDPGKGSQNYFLVEHRERTPGTYDKDVADAGLVVHRFDENVYGDGRPWVQLMTPNASSPAWDPSDPASPQRELKRPWRDGSDSRIAIRAISDRAPTMTAYFDVPGPGVLADGRALPLIKLTRGAPRAVKVPVMNTSETKDTFVVSVTSRPYGWNASTAIVTLGPGAETEVTLKLTAALDARPGGQALELNARSTTNSTSISSRFWSFVRGDGLDTDADGKADPAIFRPADGNWWILRSADGTADRRTSLGAGTDDVPAPGDYDGDGRSDVATYRPETGEWLIAPSSGGSPVRRILGESNDVPVPADYDGDGRTDPAVFRHATGEWLIEYSTSGARYTVSYGQTGDFPVPADYDGDGSDDIAVWRSVGGQWWIRSSATGSTRVVGWGDSGDQPAPGDFDRDGHADPAVFRPATGDWWIFNSATGTTESRAWGEDGDIATPGDYDGDGRTDTAIFRPTSNQWWIVDSSTGANRSLPWGEAGDLPVT